MNERPHSLSALGWLAWMSGTTNLILAYPAASRPREFLGDGWVHPLYELPVSVLFPLLFGAAIVALLVGWALLTGRSWGRVLLLTYCLLCLLLMVPFNGSDPFYFANMVGGAAFMCAMGWLMYRPAANAFFRTAREHEYEPPEAEPRPEGEEPAEA